MTIDEAIAHAREVAEIQRKDNDNCKYKSQYGCKDCVDYYSKSCIECAEEHEQLAEWLEELKAIKEKGRYVQGFRAGYKVAIGDFTEAVKELIVDLSVIRFKDIDEIAEQLKAGVNNEP